MKRHTITLGASTSAGGKVISASSNGSINGVTIALEGDAVFCPACKSQGKISCIGPRIPESWNGKNVALENDLCVCGCTIPPRLLPSQSLKYQTLDETATVDAIQAAGIAARTAAMFDDRYILIDNSTGKPLAHTEYALKGPSGHFEFGTTDADGHTHLIATSAASESIDIFL
jgi:uncharacterized Zn-binding protein involved in type VI secretion